MDKTIIINLRSLFIDDRDSRGLNSGEVVATLKGAYKLRVNKAQFDDIQGDALYYQDCGSQGWDMEFPYGVNLGRSARSVLKALEKASQEWFKTP